MSLLWGTISPLIPAFAHWASFLLLIFLGLKLLCLLDTCASYYKSLRALGKMPTFWAPLSRTTVWVKRHKQGCSRECSLPMVVEDEIFGFSSGCGWCDIWNPFRTKALTPPAARNVGSWRLRAPGIAFDWRNLHLVPGCSPYPVTSQCRECQWPASSLACRTILKGHSCSKVYCSWGPTVYVLKFNFSLCIILMLSLPDKCCSHSISHKPPVCKPHRLFARNVTEDAELASFSQALTAQCSGPLYLTSWVIGWSLNFSKCVLPQV